MPSDLRSLVIKSGTTQNISDADTLVVGTKVDSAASQALTVGGTNATGITIGKNGIDTNLPGNLAKVNNVPYVWPASQGGASTVLTNDGSGNLSWAAGGGGGTDYSVVSITTAVSQGDAVTVAGAAAVATALSSSRVAGIVSSTANKVSVLGIIANCNFDSSLTLAVGDPVYLSDANAGKLTNVAPSSPNFVAELGIIQLVNVAGGGTGAANVLWQPKTIVKP